jgi:phage terminase small subunit
MLLEAGLRARDRRDAALALVANEGLVIQDGKGRSRAHPALGIAKDAELVLLRAWRQLGLDVAAPGKPGRPQGS